MSPELEDIIKQYNSLPTEVQQVIFYGDLPGFCDALEFVHELTSDQRFFLENEISLILLGFSSRNDLEMRMVEQLEISIEKTQSIAQTIDIEILNPLAEKILHYVANNSQSQSGDKNQILPELRTMAADMLEERSPVRSTYNPVTATDEPVYQSTQPVITKPVPEAPSYNAPLYQPPKPNVDTPLEKPRWG
jgi:hypothetical protein